MFVHPQHALGMAKQTSFEARSVKSRPAVPWSVPIRDESLICDVDEIGFQVASFVVAS
jgi:hypothetical protein